MQTPSIADLQARGIPFVVREHRINKDEDVGGRPKQDLSKLHQTWKELDAIGWKRSAIGKFYGVTTCTVSRALIALGAGRKKLVGRQKMPIVVDGKRYASQDEAFRKLHIREGSLNKLLKSGRARYVR